MGFRQKNTAGLPITGSLTTVCTCTVVISTLMTVVSVGGILFRQAVYPSTDLRRMFVPNDVASLCTGLPLLPVSLFLIRRRKSIGLFSLSGALLFVLYNYLIYLFAMPTGIMFPLHLALIILSACAQGSLIAQIDAPSVRQRLAGAVPARATGGILAAFGVLFLMRAVGVLAPAMAYHTPIARTESAVDIADLLITPLWIFVGFLLILRKAYGYVVAPGLLFQAGMLFIALIVFLVLQPFLTGVPFRWIDIVVIVAMGSVCFVPLFVFIREAAQRETP